MSDVMTRLKALGFEEQAGKEGWTATFTRVNTGEQIPVPRSIKMQIPDVFSRGSIWVHESPDGYVVCATGGYKDWFLSVPQAEPNLEGRGYPAWCNFLGEPALTNLLDAIAKMIE